MDLDWPVMSIPFRYLKSYQNVHCIITLTWKKIRDLWMKNSIIMYRLAFSYFWTTVIDKSPLLWGNDQILLTPSVYVWLDRELTRAQFNQPIFWECLPLWLIRNPLWSPLGFSQSHTKARLLATNKKKSIKNIHGKVEVLLHRSLQHSMGHLPGM